MFDIKALKEQIAEKQSRLLAIAELAKAEKRELLADELAEIDRIQGVNDSSGELGDLQAKLVRAEKVEAVRKEIVKKRAEPHFGEDGIVDSKTQLIIPARAKATSKLKAFSGPRAEEEAYLAGCWAMAIITGNEKARDICNQHGWNVQAAMSTGDNSKGGYTVPDPLVPTIVRLVEEYGVFRRNIGMIWPMPNGSINVPKRSSGFTHYYPGENTEITASDPGLGLVSLVAKKGAVLGKISTELLNEDSISALGDFITQEIALAVANAEDQAGFNGDGTATYGGITGLKSALAAGAIVTTEANDNTLAEVTLAPIHETLGKIASYDGLMPKWYMHRSVWENAFKRLAFAAGGNDVMNYAAGMPQMLFGYPVEFVNVMPSGGPATILDSVIVAYFGDLGKTAVMGQTRGLNIVSDSSRYFELDQIGIRGTHRYDINIHDRGTASAAGAMVAFKMNTA